MTSWRQIGGGAAPSSLASLAAAAEASPPAGTRPEAGIPEAGIPEAHMAEREGFAALVPLHTEAMLRVAAALVGPADAEDAAQEAAVRAWQAWDSLRDIGALRPWLLRITVNVCRQWRRGGFGRRVRLVGPLPDTPDEGVGLLAALDADPGASDAAGALDLRAAVNALPEDLRVVVALRYYADMDATEVGAALGIPPATVRTRLKRALGRLRQQLAITGERRAARGGDGRGEEGRP